MLADLWQDCFWSSYFLNGQGLTGTEPGEQGSRTDGESVIQYASIEILNCGGAARHQILTKQ
jgi:hypothetical protein